MKKISTLLLVFFTAAQFGVAQEMVSSTFLRSYDKAYFYNQFGLTVDDGVDLYRLLYTTTDVHGVKDTASGLVVLPQSKNYAYSVITYHHGTAGSRYEVPGYESYEITIPSIYASFGFIVLAPDYLGLGNSRGFHPYIHADSEAWATRDMVLAAEEFYSELSYYHKKRLLVSGYSQGGHAGAAAQRLIESEDIGYEVVASALMSGPYDISSTMSELLLGDKEYPLVAYMPYVALAFDEVYNLFDGDMKNIFTPVYADIIERFRREEIDLWELNTLLLEELIQDIGQAIPARMIKIEVLEQITKDEDHPVNVALRDNDVYDWKPTADTRLLYCMMDEQVSFQNSLTAEKKMKENGALKVIAANVNSNGTHSTCVNPAVTNSVFHFLNYRDRTTSVTNTNFEQRNISLFTNPIEEGVIRLNGLQVDDVVRYVIVGMDGRVTSISGTASYGEGIQISGLIPGMYVIRLAINEHTFNSLRFIVP